MKKLLLIALLLGCGTLYAQSQKDSTNVHFKVNKYDIEKDFRNNAKALEDLTKMIDGKASSSDVDSVMINASASPEGFLNENEVLSLNRAEAVKTYIMNNNPSFDYNKLKLNYGVGKWSSLIPHIENDLDTPNREEVLSILEKGGDYLYYTIEYQLRNLGNGSAWRHIAKNYLYLLRNSSASIKVYKKAPMYAQRPIVAIEPLIEEEDMINFSFKTNILYGALALTPNIAFEMGLGKHTTLDISAGYNWFNLDGKPGDNKKLVHFIVQPELRFYLKERFKGHFFGIHGLYSDFNISNHEIPLIFGKGSQAFRFEGTAIGGGISYGYQYRISKLLGIEFTVGGGFVHLEYDKYEYPRCGKPLAYGVKDNYFGLTKAGISLIFYIF